MKRSLQKRTLAVLLTLAMLLGVFGGCTLKNGAQEETASDTVSAREETVSETAAAREEPASDTAAAREEPASDTAAAREDAPVFGASWQQVFGDKTLPADGWLKPDEAAFIRYEEDGTEVVTVMSMDGINEYLSGLGNLPRSRYLENLAKVGGKKLLFRIFDTAFELGSRKFAFPTSELRAADAASLLDYLENTYQSYGFGPQFSVTKEMEDENGNKYHFLIVQLTGFTQEDMDKHCQALEKARAIVAEMPASLDELGKAKYLYRYVCNHVHYADDGGDYYEREGWNALYDALIGGDTVCRGYAEALSALFNLAGIDCLTVNGPVVTDVASVESHAWNVAKVNGDWYIFDSTWDNTDRGKDLYLPLFFGISNAVSDTYMKRDLYFFWKNIVPACNGILDEDHLWRVPEI